MRNALLLGMCLLSGCSAPKVDIQAVAARTQTQAYVLRHTLAVQVLAPKAGAYPWLRVYLEGDGRAWLTASRPSNDPTPQRSLALELFSHETVPAAYLARPCQFVWADGCRQSLWTDARYSSAIVEAVDQALAELKARYQVERFELVGYSGGAALALLLAQQRSDIAAVQTLAGNVAPHDWTRLKKLSPLTGSLDPSLTPGVLRVIPQRHWVGRADQVVPSTVLDAYLVKVAPTCAQIKMLAADHWQGYLEPWLLGKDQPIVCP